MHFRDVLSRTLRYLGGVPGLGIFIATTLGAAGYAMQLGLRYPVADWLVWRLLPLWLWTLGLNLGLVFAGGAVFRRLVPRANVGLAERALYGLMFGMALFAFAMFGGGALGWLSPWFAAVLVALGVVVGAPEGVRLWRELKANLRTSASGGPVARLFQLAVVGFTVWMLGFVYLEALTPNSFNFDAIWYHVPTAQDYARLGKVVPFYGDNHRAYPHLASLLHTFALLAPGVEPLPVKWMLMLHLEFAMVVWRIVGVAALAQYLLGDRRVPGLGAVFFLFPSIFIYDQNIGGSADHVLGAAAVPIFLGLARTLPKFDLRWAVVTGVAAGVHILTKYQAVYMVFAVAGLVALRFGYFMFARTSAWVRSRRTSAEGGSRSAPMPWQSVWGAPLLIVGAALLVSSPHFIKNAVFYQNPVYPFLSRVFPSSFDDWEPPQRAGDEKQLVTRQSRGTRPRKAKASATAIGDEPASPPATGPRDPYDFRFRPRSYDFDPQGDSRLEKLAWANKTFFDWSFVSGNRGLTDHRPYMGALFTLLLPVLLFLRKAGRIWLAVAATYLGFLLWGLTNANDRYLLAFLTLPMGVAAALLVRAWEHRGLARVGTVCLVAVQLVWGFDAPLFYGGQRLKDALALVGSGYSGAKDEKRFAYRKAERQLTDSLPKDAVVLGRYYKDLVGIDRTMLNTHAAIQTYVDFAKLSNIRDFWQVCSDRGITHLLYPDGQRQPVRAQEAVLFDALVDVSPEKRRTHGNVIVEVGSVPPADAGPLLVFVRGIREYDDGVYPVQKLGLDNRQARPKKPIVPQRAAKNPTIEELAELLEMSSALYVQSKVLGAEENELIAERFRKVESFGSVQVWLRK